MSNYPLHIYKASAGSGKTFTLAVNYIQMVIENPEEYRHILAVTFTNKATAEMKQRILSKLYGIANKTADAQSYFEEIQRRTNLDEYIIRERAKKALQLLVHDYSHFRVETIDSFFQSILRGLARELDLGTGMTIELDTRKVISEAIDTLLQELHPMDPTLIWISDYITEELEKGNHWNITDNLKAFATNIHNEQYQKYASHLKEQLKDATFIKGLNKYISTQREIATKNLTARAEDFFKIIEKHGLKVEDFANKQGGVCGYYLKIQKGEFNSELKGRALTASQDPEGWVSKSSPLRSVILPLADQVLIPHILQTHNISKQCVTIINSCNIIQQHLNQLQLINIIHERILSLNKEANRFILADTCQMLKQMQEGDSSFVFEKLGYYIRHVMIDEFQDTSRMQWDNFYPLLLEGISAGHNSMLVGDVKQAIYRWRGSDWRILNEEVNHTFSSYTADKPYKLDTNRRSCENIINFNNKLFNQCNKILANLLNEKYIQSLQQAYNDVEQKCDSRNKGGYVRVTSVIRNDEEGIIEAMCNQVTLIIDELRSKGVPDNRISIIVRKNSQISNMVEYMSQNRPDIRIYSAEAYVLEASTAISMLITALRWIADEHNKMALIQTAIDYHWIILENNKSVNDILNDECNGFGLPEDIVNKHKELSQTPLYELCELLYRLLGLEVLCTETGYVMAFFDRLLTWCSDTAGDISKFLEYWDNELHKSAIPAGTSEGIQAMTIHKSKGLEFHSVILPYCDWELNSHKGILWVHSDDSLTQDIATIPITYASKLQESIFNEEYHNERFKQIVDNYNLLYVACTRPKENLFILKEAEKKEAKGSKSRTSGKGLTENTGQKDITTVSQLIDQALNLSDIPCLELGELTKYPYDSASSKEIDKNINPFETTSLPIDIKMISEPISMHFRQSNLSRRFISNDSNEYTRHNYLDQGLILHEILSTINIASDADRALDRAMREGLITTAKERNSISRIIRHALETPQAKDWFSGRYELFNECSIIFPKDNEARSLRPDRIMSDGQRIIVVDFKFANPHHDHNNQVRRYMELLHEMGYKEVEGYVWYGYTNQIIPVYHNDQTHFT